MSLTDIVAGGSMSGGHGDDHAHGGGHDAHGGEHGTPGVVANKRTEKMLADYKGLLKSKLNFAELHKVDDGKLIEEFGKYHTKDYLKQEALMEQQNKGHLDAIISNYVSDKLEGKVNFFHLQGKKREDAIEDFLTHLSEQAIRKYFAHKGLSGHDIDHQLEAIMKDEKMRDGVLNQVFGGQQRKMQLFHQIKTYFSEEDSDLTTAIYDAQMYGLFKPIVDYMDPVSARRDELRTEVQKTHRRAALRGYLEKQLSSAYDGARFKLKETTEPHELLGIVDRGSQRGYHRIKTHLTANSDYFHDIPDLEYKAPKQHGHGGHEAHAHQ